MRQNTPKPPRQIVFLLGNRKKTGYYNILMADQTLLATDPAELLKLARYRMPFGKYKDRLLIDLPDTYVTWFVRQGLPPGELGRMLGMLYEIKLNGLEYLFQPLRKPATASHLH